MAMEVGSVNRVCSACFQACKFGDESSINVCRVSSVSSLLYQLLASPLKVKRQDAFNRDVP